MQKVWTADGSNGGSADCLRCDTARLWDPDGKPLATLSVGLVQHGAKKAPPERRGQRMGAALGGLYAGLDITEEHCLGAKLSFLSAGAALVDASRIREIAGGYVSTTAPAI